MKYEDIEFNKEYVYTRRNNSYTCEILNQFRFDDHYTVLISIFNCGKIELVSPNGEFRELSEVKTNDKCVCPIIDLWNNGCTCGNLKRRKICQ